MICLNNDSKALAIHNYINKINKCNWINVIVVTHVKENVKEVLLKNCYFGLLKRDDKVYTQVILIQNRVR